MPHGCQLVRMDRGLIWAVGEWARTEIRSVSVGDRQVTVFGECAATDPELHRLAAHGVTNGVLTAFAGSYTVVESTARCTTVFTDPGHARPIYTTDTASDVVWGSSALALAALTNAQPDIGWLATALLVPQRPDLLTGRSAFAGITVVPPGSRLVLANDAVAQVRAAWNPAPAGASLLEGAELLRTALSDAVAVRIDSSQRPSADCSGGMDSTSLTLLAASRLDSERCLYAVTVHPAGTTRGGDLDYAQMGTEGRPAVRHLLCPLDSGHMPYSRMAGLVPPTDEPAPTTVTIARAVAEFDLLRKIGSDCHLTGDGGDTLLCGHPAYLIDLAQARHVRLLCRQAVGWARLRRTSVWPLLADAYVTAVRRRRGLPRTLRPEAQAAWSTPLARELIIEATAATAVPTWDSVSIGTCLTAEAIQTVGRTARSDAQVAEHYGVRVHNPFTDPQVIAACLAVPTYLRGSPYGYKPLLTAALA
ncbi:MAG: albusnodin/ikarugamycin family macrolactam cyclase, partial [Pseudonocardiaceae bacterium]